MKSLVLKSQFHNPRNLDEKTDFFMIHAKTTSNSRRKKKKKIKYAFILIAKGTSLEVKKKYTVFYKERFFQFRISVA